MTCRKEQIQKARKDFLNTHTYYRLQGDYDLGFGFQQGAEWADANPPDSRMAMKIEHRCQDMSAKLTIAVEALEHYREFYRKNDCRTDYHLGSVAREALAKIEGES